VKAFWTTSDLRAIGKSQRDVRRAVERGAIIAVRRGHYALPSTDPALVRAVRVGGVATGTTASRVRGLWTPPDARLMAAPEATALTPPDPRLHVAVPRNAPRLHDPDDPERLLSRSDGVVLHWTEPEVVAAASATGIAPPLVMLEHVFAAHPADRALAVTDSALKDRWIRKGDLPALADRLPAHLHHAVHSATGRADSGIESIGRFRLELLGLHVEVLVRLGRVGTVDLLIDGWLVVEMDGREFHEGERFERDRQRDLEAATARYRTLRFSWRQVMFAWPSVEAAILAALATR
jgi:very-short-patch-repair endonuclease